MAHAGRFCFPSSHSVSDGSLCAVPVPTCLVSIFSPFLMTCTSAMAWPRPKSKSAFSQSTITPALVGGSSKPFAWGERDELARGQSRLVFDGVEVRLE